MSKNLNHFDTAGNAIMVDVSKKALMERVAATSEKIFVGQEGYKVTESGTANKGVVFDLTRIAKIIAAKKISEIIPLCHTLPLSHCNLNFKTLSEELAIKAGATVKTTWAMNVDTKAFYTVNVAILMIYNLCKVLNKRIKHSAIYLELKNGSQKRGEFQFKKFF